MKTPRKRNYTLLAVYKKKLRWPDDVYRAFLKLHGANEVGGKYSAKTMDDKQLQIAVNEMKANLPAETNSTTNKLQEPRFKKIAALWICLAEAGVLDNRSKEAMITWCLRTTNVDKVEWIKGYQLNQCIEGLKSMAQRNGIVLDD